MPGRRREGLPGELDDLWRLVLAYARQETVDPLKGLARFVAYGLAGSLVLGFGLVLMLLGALRLLQTETGSTFDDRWSWVPYTLVLVVALLLAGLALKARGRRRAAS